MCRDYDSFYLCSVAIHTLEMDVMFLIKSVLDIIFLDRHHDMNMKRYG